MKKPKPNYDEIHLEFYDKDEMDEWLKELRNGLIDDFRFAIEKDYHYLLPQIEKIINKRFQDE